MSMYYTAASEGRGYRSHLRVHCKIVSWLCSLNVHFLCSRWRETASLSWSTPDTKIEYLGQESWGHTLQSLLAHQCVNLCVHLHTPVCKDTHHGKAVNKSKGTISPALVILVAGVWGREGPRGLQSSSWRSLSPATCRWGLVGACLLIT